MISGRILFGTLIIEPFPHRVLFFRAECGVRLAQDLRRPVGPPETWNGKQ